MPDPTNPNDTPATATEAAPIIPPVPAGKASTAAAMLQPVKPPTAPAAGRVPPPTGKGKAPTTKRKGPRTVEWTYFDNRGDCPTVTYAGKKPTNAGGIPWAPGQSQAFWAAEEAAQFEGMDDFTVSWPSGNPLAK